MKLGLLHEVDTLKASLGEQLCYVSFEHKSLQELAAAMYITQVLDEAENIEVSVNYLSMLILGILQWQIQDFSEVGASTYDLAKFPQKLHEIERIWTPRRASLMPPLDTPLFCVLPYGCHDMTTSPCLLVCLNKHITSKIQVYWYNITTLLTF